MPKRHLPLSGMRDRAKRSTILRAGAGTAALALILAACSSSGGRVSRPTITVPPPTNTVPPAPPAPPAGSNPADYRTPEYNLSWALEAIHAAEAYATGVTGDGSIVGFVDFNFDFSSAEVRYDSASRGPNSQAVAMYRAQTGSNPGTDTHGHAMAVIAAGVKNALGTHGVAFDASVIAVDFFSMVNVRQEIHNGKRYNIADPWTYLTQRGARIISKSYGYDTSDIISNPPVVQEYYVNDSPAQAIANGALLVASAGNESGASPILSNLDTIDDMRENDLLSGPGAFVIAGAVDQNNNIAGFSNRAGSARSYFLVAPGVSIVTPYNGSLSSVSGTSISAPLVAGAAAVILQRWPTLNARQLADILFASATDLGAPGIDAIYGHGLLNVHAALQPLGTTSFAVADGAPAVDSSALVLGSAFGDAPSLRAALTNTMMLDGFGRDFRIDASKRVLSRPHALAMASLLRQRLAWQGAQVDLGAASVSFGLQEDWQARSQTSAGAQRQDPVQSVLQFNGVAENLAWTFGSGLALRDALGSRLGDVSPSTLTHAFSSVVDATPGLFAAFRVDLGDRSGLSFGISQAEAPGIAEHPLPAFREAAPVRSAALRLDTEHMGMNFGATLGALIEDGLVLGARSAGGLLLGETTATMWGEFAADIPLTVGWIGQGILTLAYTDPRDGGASLIDNTGSVLSTSFSLGILQANMFLSGDRLSFTLHQPLHAESAPLTLVSGMYLDETTGAAILGPARASLVPSGRELGLESSYRLAFAGWNAEANLAYRFDAGHIAGRREVAAMLTLARRF